MKKILLKIFLIMGATMLTVLGISRLGLYIIESRNLNNPVLSYHISLIAGFWGLLFFATLLYLAFGNRLKKISDAVKEVSSGNLDISITAKGKDELAELAENFNLMTKGLQANEYLSREFVKNVSHEFKTPVSTIKGYAELLKNGNISDDERKEYSGIICEQAERLNNLSVKLLKISRLDSDAPVATDEKVRADEQIRQVILSLQHQWKQKNLDPEVDLERVCITSNGDLCYLIWQNIISNAVKYSESDSKICIKLCIQNGDLLFSVSNKGESLKGKEDLIFEPFYTTDRSGAEKGTGLGLPLVKKTVNRLGGKIGVSVRDGLNVFTVVLPLSGNQLR